MVSQESNFQRLKNPNDARFLREIQCHMCYTDDYSDTANDREDAFIRILYVQRTSTIHISVVSLSCALDLIKIHRFTNDFQHLLFPPAPEAINLKSLLELLFTEDYIGSADEDDDMTEEREQMFDVNTSSRAADLIDIPLYPILERHFFVS